MKSAIAGGHTPVRGPAAMRGHTPRGSGPRRLEPRTGRGMNARALQVALAARTGR